MSHWAELDENNKVIRVLVGANDADEGKSFFDQLGGTWVRTSYNAATNGFRKNYASIGFIYDAERDAFIAGKCHDEAILNESNCRWECTNDKHQASPI